MWPDLASRLSPHAILPHPHNSGVPCSCWHPFNRLWNKTGCPAGTAATCLSTLRVRICADSVSATCDLHNCCHARCLPPLT
jgi:hypothetical protein